MAVETNYQGMLNQGESLFVTFYNVETAIIQLVRLDATNTSGELYAGNIIQKQYAYDAIINKSNAPLAMYGFPAVDSTWTLPTTGQLSTVNTFKEWTSGRTLVTAAGVGQAGNYTGLLSGNNRLNSKYWMIPPGSWVYDNTAGADSLALRDSLGQDWTWTGWVYWAANAQSFIYLETDNAVSKYWGIQITSTGLVQLVDNLRGGIFNICAVTLNNWSFIGVVYSASGGVIQGYKNGLQANPITAYTHGTVSGMTRNHISYGAQTASYIQSVNTYNYALSAWQFDFEWHWINDDFISGGVLNQGGTMAQGATVYVRYNDASPPSFSQPGGSGIWQLTLPAQGVGRIQTLNGVAERIVWDMKITERSD